MSGPPTEGDAYAVGVAHALEPISILGQDLNILSCTLSRNFLDICIVVIFCEKQYDKNLMHLLSLSVAPEVRLANHRRGAL